MEIEILENNKGGIKISYDGVMYTKNKFLSRGEFIGNAHAAIRSAKEPFLHHRK